MKKAFYPRLAWNGIHNNRRYYIPYILAGIMMTAIFYIMNFLNASEYVASMVGGSALVSVFGFGIWVIALFAFIYLFYTNSFLIRVRDRELGLYNILGMNRKNIVSIIACESIVIFAIVISAGMVSGIALSKIAELVLAHLMEQPVNMEFTLQPDVLSNTFFVFAAIYTILFLYSVFRIGTTKALDLLKGTSYGEKQPKGNLFFAVIGLLIMGIAYYMAITIKEPLLALSTFFIAVILVIIATYILFITGSVVLCRVLQKDSRYYYKASHFISVSTMRFRMKRNGAGLASICILMTMVLVMMTITASLYAGLEDSMAKNFPTDIIVDISLYNDTEVTEEMKNTVISYMDESIPDRTDELCNEYIYLASGTFTDDGYYVNPDEETWSANELFVLDEKAYNNIYDKQITLNPYECILISKNKDLSMDTYSLYDYSWKVTQREEGQPITTGVNISAAVAQTIVIHDYSQILDDAYLSTISMHSLHYVCNVKEGTAMNASSDGLFQTFRDTLGEMDGGYSLNFKYKPDSRAAYIQLYGGIFMLCVMLSIIFLLSAVMIIYYKQISEGFEDQKRFAILHKVGMTDHEIRSSINSQILIMFFMPLITAGIHLSAAWPMLYRILIMFGITNQQLTLIVTVIVYLIFAAFYGIIYRLTSNTYFRIVYSGN